MKDSFGVDGGGFWDVAWNGVDWERGKRGVIGVGERAVLESFHCCCRGSGVMTDIEGRRLRTVEPQQPVKSTLTSFRHKLRHSKLEVVASEWRRVREFSFVSDHICYDTPK